MLVRTFLFVVFCRRTKEAALLSHPLVVLLRLGHVDPSTLDFRVEDFLCFTREIFPFNEQKRIVVHRCVVFSNVLRVNRHKPIPPSSLQFSLKRRAVAHSSATLRYRRACSLLVT